MYQVSAFDLHHIVLELQDLVRGKVDKIYQPQKKVFLIGLHVPGHGKELLKIIVPNVLYRTKYKEEMPKSPPQFCLMLRKYLGGAFLRKVEQINFERIIRFEFDTRFGTMFFVCELFSKGNIILTDEKNIIKSVLMPQKWKDRTLRGNVEYEYPKKGYNPLTITFDELASCFDDSDKESVVKTLALDLGLGGKYAEEVCTLGGVDKDKYYVDGDVLKKIYAGLEKLRSAKTQVMVGKTIYPIKMMSLQDLRPSEKSFNEALDDMLSENLFEEAEKQSLAPYEKEKRKLEKQIMQQEQQIKKMRQAAEETRKIGETIYNNYQEFDSILKQANQLFREHDQKSVKKILKSHPKIREINFKEKTCVVETED